MHNKDLEVKNDDPEVREEKVNMAKCNRDWLSRLLYLTAD